VLSKISTYLIFFLFSYKVNFLKLILNKKEAKILQINKNI
jgi:hypothetical protein